MVDIRVQKHIFRGKITISKNWNKNLYINRSVICFWQRYKYIWRGTWYGNVFLFHIFFIEWLTSSSIQFKHEASIKKIYICICIVKQSYVYRFVCILKYIIFEDYFTKIKLNNFDQIFKIMLNKYCFYKNVIV